MAPTQPDHSGLQFIQPNDAPEVVPGSTAEGKLGRRNSLTSPQVAYENDPEPSPLENGYFQPQSTPEKDARAYYGPGSPPGYSDEASKQVGPAGEDTKPPKAQSRVCGLRKRTFYIILGVVLVVVVVAAVAGGVAGGLSNKSHSNSQATSTSSPSSSTSSTSSATSSATLAPLQVRQNTGVTVISPAGSTDGSTHYTYTQAANGTIIESVYSSSGLTNRTASNVVTSNAIDQSPLAATSWVSQGTTYRQLFFLDNNDQVMTTNTTTSTWSTPYSVLTGDSAASGSIALAVCAGTAAENTGLDGLRVYYGSTKGYIQEVGMDFFESTSQPIWHMWMAFNGSDNMSGASCALNGNVNHLYLRNTTTKAVQQLTWDYVNVSQWNLGVAGPSNITSGGDIAAINDGASTDHIFYQSTDGSVERALYNNNAAALSGFETLAAGLKGTKLGATYFSQGSSAGAVVLYQTSGNASAVSYEEVARSGAVVSSGSGNGFLG